MPDSAVVVANAPVPAAVALPVRWRLQTRLLFRFLFVYFTAYILTTQMLGGLVVLPHLDFPSLEELPPVRTMYGWTARHVFHITRPLVVVSGSGDKTLDWVGAFCLVVLAAAAAVIWSVLDRRRPHYRELNAWFRVFLRFALGTTMLTYGMVKAFPLQMQFPSPLRLLERYGDFSSMGVLWASIGAAPAYERFAGGMELAAAVLLFIPGLSTLGACVAFADTVQILTLNLTYDVPVKLFAFHLVVLSLVLLAPEFRRILNVLVLNRTAPPSSQPRVATGRITGWVLVIAQVGLGAYFVGMSYLAARRLWVQVGPGAAKPPLYGIWDVDKISIDGVERPPLLTDAARWRRVIVLAAPERFVIQGMDDTFTDYLSATDGAHHVVSVKPRGEKTWSDRLSYDQPSPGHLRITGRVAGRDITAELRLLDTNTLLLLKRGFHWVQEYPFNR